jgi:hypothetical protein
MGRRPAIKGKPGREISGCQTMTEISLGRLLAGDVVPYQG